MAALKFVRSVYKDFLVKSGLEPTLLQGVKITAATPGKVAFELPIEKQHCNRLEIIHGGTIASMVDMGGSLVLASRGLWSTGVSIDLNVTYLSAGGKVGDVIRGEAVCDKFGKTLAFTTVRFLDKDDKVVARGSHTKFVALAQKDENNIVDELKPEENESKASNALGASGSA